MKIIYIISIFLWYYIIYFYIKNSKIFHFYSKILKFLYKKRIILYFYKFYIIYIKIKNLIFTKISLSTIKILFY